MALTDEGTNTTMLVQPSGMGNGGFGFGDNGWWIILLFILLGGWGALQGYETELVIVEEQQKEQALQAEEEHIPYAAYFKEFATGSGIPLVSKGVLEQMPVKLPSLKAQQAIADLVKLGRKEQEILTQIVKQKNLILETEISKYLESL